MYQDWKQWARAVYAILILLMVGWLIKPEQLIHGAGWQEIKELWWGTGFVQAVLFTVSAGLIFPKEKKLEENFLDVGGDFWQFIVGCYLNGFAWFIAIL
ncbi:hypothetical protein HMY34_16955 [Thiothrix subterranea]|uniref:hypothetical protein n=1 Tax=Thiothrix subterranea TaxID=2735563 RepID=UPI00192B4E2E|nr:hypothetical protein [Thiothrix subterranea]QQZ30309.1 hypothetical protein HMY34_16955 [Thiothrix subterranea]